MMPGGRKGLAPPFHRHGTLLVREGIFADSSQSEWINLPPSEQIKLPVLPSHWKFQTILISMGVQMNIFPLIWFSVTMPVGGSLPWPEVLMSTANL